MRFLNKLLNFTSQRVKKFGAQYITFAIFGMINYPLALVYELLVNNDTNNIIFRITALLFCFLLMLKDYWPQKYKKFLPLFWYITVTVSLPMMTSFMLLKNNLSLGWLINFNIGAMITMLLLDSVSFIIVETIGVALGVALFFIFGNHLTYEINYDYLSLFVYMFVCITIFGLFFVRNKEIFNHLIQKTKDDLNIELEEKVLERTFELKNALAVKTEFLNNMSHEIRTPIQGFMGISEGLDLSWDRFDDAQKHKYVHDIAKSAQRLASLVNNILDLSKFNNGQFLLDLHEIDFKQLVTDIIDESITLYLNEKNIKIIFNDIQNTSNSHLKEKMSGKIILMGDYERLGQVLRNLFINAIKFSPIDSVITINITLENADKIHFSITDQGLGIPEDELNSIFDPFTQSSRTNTKAGGVGLGLSICKKIITAHNGTIWAENNQDTNGSSFHFLLPSLIDKP